MPKPLVHYVIDRGGGKTERPCMLTGGEGSFNEREVTCSACLDWLSGSDEFDHQALEDFIDEQMGDG